MHIVPDKIVTDHPTSAEVLNAFYFADARQ